MGLKLFKGRILFNLLFFSLYLCFISTDSVLNKPIFTFVFILFLIVLNVVLGVFKGIYEYLVIKYGEKKKGRVVDFVFSNRLIGFTGYYPVIQVSGKTENIVFNYKLFSSMTKKKVVEVNVYQWWIFYAVYEFSEFNDL